MTMNYLFHNIYHKNKLHTILFVTLILLSGIYLNTISAANKKDRPITIVIDPGHGGKDIGATDNGAREKDINLNVSKKLAALLSKNKNIKVIMTRNDDSFVSLQERANIANRNAADLFISIHTNSVDKSNPNRTTVAGASVYALGPQKDANNLQVAYRENSVIELESNYEEHYSGFDPSRDESYIIFELSQKQNLGQSLKFADKAQKELVKTAERLDRGVKQAGFWVLWATSMPSVLVELDFICNPNEAAFLTSDDGQDKLALALFNAINSFYEASPLMASNSKASHSATTQKNNVVSDRGPEANKSKQKDSSAKNKNKNTNSSSNILREEKEEELPLAHNLTDDSDISVKEVATLSQPSQRVKNEHIYKEANKRPAVRRRRSASSREVSLARNVETGSIVIHDENEYLAQSIAESTNSQPSPKSQVSNAETQDSKSKKNKNKETKKNNKKETKKQNKVVAQTDTKKDNNKEDVVAKSGRKTFVVKNNTVSGTYLTNTNQITGQPKTTANENSTKRVASQSSQYSTETVYQILLMTSERELSDNDPCFAGFTPTGVYLENNQYKYTYGSSKNRREIETKLLEVKTYLPEASIVVRAN